MFILCMYVLQANQIELAQQQVLEIAPDEEPMTEQHMAFLQQVSN